MYIFIILLFIILLIWCLIGLISSLILLLYYKYKKPIEITKSRIIEEMLYGILFGIIAAWVNYHIIKT